jgi:hypothetical protein
MTVTANRCAQQAVDAAPTLIDVFRLRCEARAILVAEGEMDFHEAVDGLQEGAVEQGLVADLGQDAVQAIMAEAFAKVPRPGELEDAVAELADGLNNLLIEEIAKPRSEVAKSTLDAAVYLVRQNDPERLRLWLAKHPPDQCAAILRLLEQREATC